MQILMAPPAYRQLATFRRAMTVPVPHTWPTPTLPSRRTRPVITAGLTFLPTPTLRWWVCPDPSALPVHDPPPAPPGGASAPGNTGGPPLPPPPATRGGGTPRPRRCAGGPPGGDGHVPLD